MAELQGLSIDFPAEATALTPSDIERIQRWLANRDDSDAHYLAIAHTYMANPAIRKLSRDRAAAVATAIRRHSPTRRVDVIRRCRPSRCLVA